MSDRERTALHEAGHAVAHRRHRIDQGVATIEPRVGRLGSVSAEGVSHVWTATEAERMVEAFCAGYAALIAAGLPPADAERGTGDDFEQAQHLIHFWRLEGDLEHWKARAVALIGQPENARAVALVAEHLQRWTTLDSEYIDVLIDLADGETTEQEFQQYLDGSNWSERHRQMAEHLRGNPTQR